MGYRKLGGFEKLPAVDLIEKGPGTKTTVTFLESKTFPSQYGDKEAVAYIVTHGGEKKQFYGTTVLNRILQEARPGDELEITYLGEEKSPTKGNRPFKNFEVVVVDPEYSGDDREQEGASTEAKKKGDVPF